MNAKPILVVGAGFAGACYARTLAEAGHTVRVIDSRSHIGGNAYDEIDRNGNRIHRYGPHLFHTSNEQVVNWVTRFGEWTPYEHRVDALLADGQLAPLPVNRTTINTVFGESLTDEHEVKAFLERRAIPCETPRNAAEYLYSKIGTDLTDLFFRPYTKKMWLMDLEQVDISVVSRVQIRYDDEDRYFPGDKFQIMPVHGYTSIFERIFDHPNIEVALNQPFDKAMEKDYLHCFNSMPIDVYFDNALGELPYRSIKFHHSTRDEAADWKRSVINFTDARPFTRETAWYLLPHHRQPGATGYSHTLEEPCDYRDNNLERYYPVKTADMRYQNVYKKYAELADRRDDITFIGRCGTYQYLDMHQVINQSLMGAEKWLKRR
ncbi:MULTISPECIES: UDP-galactopyranose mutase [Methylobacterium]|uniref:UDP-galactopyranose mutase n=1 Tax=Methylobacterium TaxID=407 RepID=UPI0013E9C036|nr:UDP-galactopyranose mutase [Methylobacterium sp. DB0501]NGM36336.1 NAD(P)-binding protein [Methylobacterium sp. DB0501]